MSRPQTVELTSKPIKLWAVVSEIGILLAIAGLIDGSIHIWPNMILTALILGPVSIVSRIAAGAARWWVNG